MSLRRRRPAEDPGQLALARLAQLEAQRAAERRERDAFLPQPTYVLSHVQEGWHVPVVRVEAPGMSFLVMATGPGEGYERLAPLSMFALGAAFRAPMPGSITELDRAGWAFVQAHPLNIPGFLADCPGYHTDRYALCVLRHYRIWKSLRDSGSLQAEISLEQALAQQGASQGVSLLA